MATKNIVPRANGEGNLGTAEKTWNKVYTNDVILPENKSLNVVLAGKLDKNQGVENAGKSLEVGEDGLIKLGDGGGHLIVPALPSPAEAKEKVVYFVYDAVSKSMRGYIKHGDAMVEIGKNDGVPIGTHSWWFGSMETIPQGWVAFDGSEYAVDGICKALYPIFGNKYGGTPGVTFRLPNLIGKWVKGDTVAGTELEAGLPNIEGSIGNTSDTSTALIQTSGKNNIGALFADNLSGTALASASGSSVWAHRINIDASRSNSIYGNADTVQPPSVTAIPIIKAFSADVESIESTTEQQLRNEIAQHSGEIADLVSKADIVAQGNNYIRYANGLQMCWEVFSATRLSSRNFPMPFKDNNVFLVISVIQGAGNDAGYVADAGVKTDGTGFSNLAVYYGNKQWASAANLRYLAIGRWK